MFLSLILSTLVAASSGIDDNATGDETFDFYFGEFVNHELQLGHPMAKLVAVRLADTMFDTTSESVFKRRIELLKTQMKNHPEKIDRFIQLDRMLNSRFDEKLKQAKQKRLIYTAVGAVAGALIAIPVGKMIAGSSASLTRTLLIAIPIGALAGAGAGFLLSNLLIVPGYTYHGDLSSVDLESMDEKIAKLGRR